MPTFDRMVPPEIVTMVASMSSFAVTVDLTLISSGSSYCGIGLLGDALPDSASDIILQYLQGEEQDTLSNGMVSHRVTIPNLHPLTDYQVHCLTVSPLGVESSLDAILATRQDVRTACCKAIAVDMSTATVPYLVTVVNILSLAVSTLPSSHLNITLQVTKELPGPATGIYEEVSSAVFSPSRFTVDTGVSSVFVVDDAVHLQASLYPLLEGHYQLTLILSGSASNEFTVNYGGRSSGETGLLFSVLAADDPLPAPVFKQVRFSNDGSKIHITFDSNTNYGETATTFQCDELFEFPCSSTSSCYWTSATEVRVDLVGTSTCAVPNDLLTLNATALIKAQCDPVLSSCVNYMSWPATPSLHNTSIAAPNQPIRPTVVLSAPSIIGRCDVLTLDRYHVY